MTKQNKIISVITSLFVVLLLVGVIGAIIHFVNINKDEITEMLNPTFRIEYDGEVYKADTKNIIALPEKGKVRFEVKGTSSYSVTIVPNVTAGTDFNYTVSGITYKYGDEKSLSPAFDLKCYEGAFTIDADVDFTLENILLKLWSGSSEIAVGEHGSFPAYKCEVTSSKGEAIELLWATCITDIMLSENIVF